MPKNRGKSRKQSVASAGTPRLDSEKKLLSRFYEPLVLLDVLGSTRGTRIPRPPLDGPDESGLDLCELQRVFLDRLAYLCDFMKGGDTVTAIALEDTPQGVVFWLAANKDPYEKVRQFLKGILVDIGGIGNAPLGECRAVEDRIFLKAVKFGIQRVETYWRFLQKATATCLKSLNIVGGHGDSHVDDGLATWLKSFRDHKNNMPSLCEFAYEARRSQYMKELSLRSNQGWANLGCEESVSRAFAECRHHIGRLGSYRRAAKSLVAAGVRLPFLFDNFRIRFCASQTPSSPPPAADHKTTLNGIVVRMLPATAVQDVKYYQEALDFMDVKFQLFDRFLKQYENKNFRPRVHAELIVLEDFYHKRLKFVGGDKYIGSSKPACYCCYHYICAHPGGFVRPACHNKNYINWLPPNIAGSADGSAVQHRRAILNDMVKQIRLDVLGQIKERRSPHARHPDSTTGISPSVDCEWQDPSRKVEVLSDNKHEALPPLVEVDSSQQPSASEKDCDAVEVYPKGESKYSTPKVKELTLSPGFRYSDDESDSDGGVLL